MSPLDPRRHPYRPDLAAAHLQGQVEAERFVEGRERRLRVGVAALTATPEPNARRVSEALFGEVFTVYDRADGWSWGQLAEDGYVGWLENTALDEERPAADGAPTHRVRALASFLHPEPDVKCRALDSLPLGVAVRVLRERAGWAELAGGGWLFAGHLGALECDEPDVATTALRLLGVPYLWGGRTARGIDCSGLAQLACRCAGWAAPRDSDMQRGELGALISEDGMGCRLERGDLVYFPGHVGLMADATRLIHATAATMTVTIEPLDEVAARGGGIQAVRRLPARPLIAPPTAPNA